MLFKDIIRRKRDGGVLEDRHIADFVDGLTSGDLPGDQASALAMAICIRGMNPSETGTLTDLMAHSGTVLDWTEEDLRGPAVDKHSTGGVGDKVSFILAPLAAACGCAVPMISGRSLGHTGGTLDKLDAIPGYVSQPGLDIFRKVVRHVGCAIVGQTDDLAPADRRLYAIRDSAGSVESIPLITASILSKKRAAGNAALVMDIKVGSGAFMESTEEALALAQSLVSTGERIGLKVGGMVTDMNEVLGRTAGNGLEVSESVAFLRGVDQEPRLAEISIALTAEMLVITGLSDSEEDARAKVIKALDSGAGAEVFGQMVHALGGPVDFVDRASDYLPAAPVSRPVLADQAGYLTTQDTRAIGNAIINLGGGRKSLTDRLDLSVGFSQILPMGSQVEQGAVLAHVHAADDDAANRAADAYRAAVSIGEHAPELPPLIAHRLAAGVLS